MIYDLHQPVLALTRNGSLRGVIRGITREEKPRYDVLTRSGEYIRDLFAEDLRPSGTPQLVKGNA